MDMPQTQDSEKVLVKEQITQENTQEDISTQRAKEASLDSENADHFYQQYSVFFSKINETFLGLQQHSQGTLDSYFKRLHEIKEQAKQDDDLTKDAGQFIREKTEELINKNKTQDELKTRLKEFIHELTPKKLTRLKPEESEILGQIFAVLYEFYYGDSKGQYNWVKFKKDLVENNGLKDFQNCAMAAEYAKLTCHQRDALDNVRKQLMIERSERPTIKLLRFLDLLFEIIDVQEEIQELQYEIPAAKLDAFHRVKRADKEIYSGEVLYGNINYLTKLHQGVVEMSKAFEEEEGKFKELKETYLQRKIIIKQNTKNEEIFMN